MRTASQDHDVANHDSGQMGSVTAPKRSRGWLWEVVGDLWGKVGGEPSAIKELRSKEHEFLSIDLLLVHCSRMQSQHLDSERSRCTGMPRGYDWNRCV